MAKLRKEDNESTKDSFNLVTSHMSLGTPPWGFRIYINNGNAQKSVLEASKTSGT